MYGKDPYYKAFSELESITTYLTQKCKEYKDKAKDTPNYSKYAEIRLLYDSINAEIDRFDGMYNVLENIINNVKKNPERFLEISNDEINMREKRLKEKYEMIANCREQVFSIYNDLKEKEIQAQRKLNRDFLLSSHVNIDDRNQENNFYNVEVSNRDENLEFLNQNTKKLHNAALIISQELNEHNNLIQGMINEVENESKLDT